MADLVWEYLEIELYFFGLLSPWVLAGQERFVEESNSQCFLSLKGEKRPREGESENATPLVTQPLKSSHYPHECWSNQGVPWLNYGTLGLSSCNPSISPTLGLGFPSWDGNLPNSQCNLISFHWILCMGYHSQVTNVWHFACVFEINTTPHLLTWIKGPHGFQSNSFNSLAQLTHLIPLI